MEKWVAIDVGSTPTKEDSYQSDYKPSRDFYQNARKECVVYKAQLKRKFPDCIFRIRPVIIKNFKLRFLEVQIVWDKLNSQHDLRVKYVNLNLPEFWDEVSKMKLNLPKYLKKPTRGRQNFVVDLECGTRFIDFGTFQEIFERYPKAVSIIGQDEYTKRTQKQLTHEKTFGNSSD